MAIDATKIKVAGSGAIWKAPAGTTLPSDSTTAYGAAFVNLGWISDGGFEVDQSLKTKNVMGWQSVEVLRVVNTSIERSVKFSALESNKEVVQLAWGGATITASTAGIYSVDLPAAQVITEFILGIDWFDGSTTQRILIKRAVLKSLPKVKFSRQDAINYDFEIMALAPADGSDAIIIYGVDAGVS
jgi:hypothetical protein